MCLVFSPACVGLGPRESLARWHGAIVLISYINANLIEFTLFMVLREIL